jgi:hypothetical protein
MMSVTKNERRHAQRVNVNIPTLVEVIGQREVKLHPNLEKVYERVPASGEMVGEKFPAVVRDLSTNGAFISGPALPLLSRIAFTFPLDGHGQVEVLAWTLWRRNADCELPQGDGDAVKLQAGFGVLFEAIPLEARQAIARMVAGRKS